jgi:RHH-type proline utilization regulon transcriptional repressor/proline dehydrogenase/delta 1-pyrroline-5-carboxylate dehydrogenase
MADRPIVEHGIDAVGDQVADAAVDLVAQWMTAASASRRSAADAKRLADLLDDPDGVVFAMRFVDRVIRPEDNDVAARQFADIVADSGSPKFLGPIDRVLMQLGARLAPMFPEIVMPLAKRRMRALVGHLIADADPDKLGAHLARETDAGFSLNVNLLGEAVLGEDEAERRFAATCDVLARDDVDYASIKISAIVSQLNLWAFDHTLDRVEDRLRTLYRAAQQTSPPKFVNLDMEEYRDLELTVEAFTTVLDEPEFAGLTAGIVLQAYLPDSFPYLQRLTAWANERSGHGGHIKIRLVKGANLAMEKTEAALHGWEQAPYRTKEETDANYKRCLDWVLTAERTKGVRVGVASHNLFDVAWAHLLAQSRGVADRVDFEMLKGMAPDHASNIRDLSYGMRLYTPVVRREDFDTSISYLIRRLEENSSPENFIHSIFRLAPASREFAEQEERFRRSLAIRWEVSAGPNRLQDRSHPQPFDGVQPFANEPDTDPALPANRVWLMERITDRADPLRAPLVTDTGRVDEVVARAVEAQRSWWARPADERRDALHRVADTMANRRGDLLTVMIHEAAKTPAEADPEISEAIDFARWYADHAVGLGAVPGARFEPLGVVTVVPPWNFPVAIPAGGVFAALAAGSSVILKPAPETPKCAEVLAEICWEAGIPADVLQYLRVPDDAVGRHLVTHDDVGGVILTGSWETAGLFKSWKPALRLFAETSGKNALVVSPHADLDLAAADLVASAFGHSGQKCSAASLGILVGDVYDSDRFRRQLVDAARSLHMGQTADLETVFGPVIRTPEDPLLRALTTLDEGEAWLLEPQRLDDEGRLWSPGIRLGVAGDSWFHETECFGPVLGLMRARDLDHAIDLQNASDYGLTGGIHTLEADEVEQWLDAVEVGNAYVNRKITGAIVRRQPFGGWKRSAVGPGAKAGGPNYVAQLGTWHPDGEPDDPDVPIAAVRRASDVVATQIGDRAASWLRAAARSDEAWWQREIGWAHDPSALGYEANILRYLPRPDILIRIPDEGRLVEGVRCVMAAIRAGGAFTVSMGEHIDMLGELPVQVVVETEQELMARLSDLRFGRVRHVGDPSDDFHSAAWQAEVDVDDAPVTAAGRVELIHYVREQAISRTMHRFGNILEAASIS